MDAQQFLAEFGHIANAPGGVARLRELILQLAIQGKLISSSGEPSKTKSLVDDIKSIKASLIADKKLPRDKPFPRVSEKEVPNERPEHWAWVRFGELWQLLSGRDLSPGKYNDSEHGIPYITGASNIENGVINVNRWTPEPVVVSCIGDLLITCKGTIGKTAFNRLGDIHIARQIMAIRDFSGKHNSDFLKVWLDGFVSQLIEKSKGMIPGFSREDIYFAIYPVVPLEEQARIVAKVDELMALCDKLEAQQQKRSTLQNHLRQATLQAVAASQSPHELQDGWQRLQANFGQLFSAPEDVIAFKGLILDLAVSGNLSNIEHRHESTGEQLLGAIAQRRVTWSHETEGQEKKEALTMLKKLRTQLLTLPEKNIPTHWAWASLLQVAQVIIDCDHKTPTYADQGIHLIRTTDIRDGNMHLGATKKVSQESYLLRSKRLTPQPDDIFFTREAPMGEAAIVPSDQIVCLGQRLMLIRLFTDLLNERYLIYVIRSPEFQRRIQESAVGMAVKHINVRDVETLMLPVPPKPEQDAIVNIIDTLFEICDRFEKQLSKKRRIAESLVTSSVAALTGIAIEQEEEPMKAPQTELVAPVRLGTPPDVKAQAPLATILARHNGEMSAKDLWQRFGGEIDAFYAQLKTEVAHGWLLEPAPAEMREKA
ncbi:restriction endonuclease subunit S [Vibrio fluvialis]|uniref:restriction endonuclease subunit S n=1 Tax=Vibrio fluvialis TaxID=676 RepID=UPI001F37FDC1|nr:restriction endonuclease subunit S [Vibrio fluvialis]MCE7585385.1 restriction endonuclease subunit S [Vibrio fluvialis]